MIKVKRELGYPVLLLDAGNSLFSGTRKDLNAASEGRITVEAMNLMGYDAMAIGPRDVAAGLELLQARLSEAEFAVVSANLMVGGKLLAQPYVLLEKDGIKIAIIGLTSPDVQASKSVQVLDPLETARQYVGQLRSQVDVVVVLSNLGPSAEQALADSVPGIDVVVGGGSGSPSRAVSAAEGVALVRAGGLGEYLGVTEIGLDSENKPFAYSHQSLLLAPNYPDDQEMVQLKQRYQEQYGSQTSTQPE
ncbi:MAG: hypothetical protein ACUVWR_10590 [Anaerolineae bacterium]